MRSLALVCLALAAFGLRAAGFDSVPLTVPTVTAGATSNSITARIYPVSQEYVALSWNTSSTNVTVRISAIVDEALPHTNYFVIGFGSGTTITNLNIGGIGVLNIDSVACTGTINATNSVSWGRKSIR